MMVHAPTREVLRQLTPQLSMLFVATLAALAALVALTQFHQQATQRLKLAMSEQGDLRRRLENFDGETEILRRQLRQYEELVDRGVLGPEQRLKWIETLQNIKRQRHLLDLHYELGPQQPFGLSAQDHPFRFFASPMTLDLVATHEGDIVGVLEDLRSQAPAYVRPHHCLLERKEHSATSPLHLLCKMDWITIQALP